MVEVIGIVIGVMLLVVLAVWWVSERKSGSVPVVHGGSAGRVPVNTPERDDSAHKASRAEAKGGGVIRDSRGRFASNPAATSSRKRRGTKKDHVE